MNPSCPDFHSANVPSRRTLLKAGLAGFAGLNLSTLLRASTTGAGPAPRAKHVIFLHQFGGPSHIDTFDMKPTAPEKIRGDFKPIASSVPGVTVTEHLPRFAKVLHHFAQIRSVNHNVKNHNSATYYSLTGHAPPLDDIRLRDTIELYPAYAGTVSKFKPVADPAIPTAVSYPYVLRDGSVTPGQTASFLGKEFDPFFIGQDPSSPAFRLPELSLPPETNLARLGDRRELLRAVDKQAELLENAAIAQGIDRFYDRALTMLGSPVVKKAFDLSQEDAKLRDRYGRTSYGQSCLLARRLVESGVRFVTVYFSESIGGAAGGGWDTHGDNCNRLKNRLLPITDQTVPTLIEDLEARGLLDETLIVWMGEFGRTPRIATTQQFGADGRDHWPKCYTVLMAGGGIRGGSIFGASDKIGGAPSIDPVSPDDIAATMYWALGIDPQSEFYDALKRPLPIAAGKPITGIFG